MSRATADVQWIGGLGCDIAKVVCGHDDAIDVEDCLAAAFVISHGHVLPDIIGDGVIGRGDLVIDAGGVFQVGIKRVIAFAPQLQAICAGGVPFDNGDGSAGSIVGIDPAFNGYTAARGSDVGGGGGRDGDVTGAAVKNEGIADDAGGVTQTSHGGTIIAIYNVIRVILTWPPSCNSRRRWCT